MSVPTAEYATLHPRLTEMYGGEVASQYAHEVVQLEMALDAEWPSWRVKKPFNHLPQKTLKRIKWLLKRHNIILSGNGDFGLKVVMIDGEPFMSMCRPLAKVRKNPQPQYYIPHTSAPYLADKAKLPLERVESWLEAWDGTGDPLVALKGLPKQKAKKPKALKTEGA